MFSSLSYQNYRRIFLYSCLNSSAGWASTLAIEWLVLDLTGSAAALGAMIGIQIAPVIFLSLIGGSFADKFSEKRVLLVTAILLIFINIAMFLSYKNGVLNFGLLGVLAFMLTTVWAVQGPVFTALSIKVVPEERVANAISLNSVTFNIGRLFGPVIAGYLIAIFDTGTPFIYLAALYLFVILVLSRIKMEDLHQKSSAAASGNLREAFAYLNKKKNLYVPMVLTGIFVGLGMNFSFNSSLMVRKVFEEDSRHLGFVGIFLAIGGMIGAGYAARLSVSGHRPTFATLTRSGIALGLFWLATSFAPTFWVFAALALLVNLFHLMVMATANGMIAAYSPVDIQGRVYGIYLFIFHIGFGIGGPLIGLLAQATSIRFMVGLGGAVVLLLSLIFVTLSKKFTFAIND